MKDTLLPFALQNAMEHEGKASFGSIMGKAMTIFPELRKDPKNTSKMVKELVNEVNSMTIEEQKKRYSEIGEPMKLERRRREGLPELEGAQEGKVVMRFAPGPSGPLHIGHTRAAILNDIYCKKYKGQFILRLEDTNPEKIDPDAYDMIPEDLEWLGINIDETYIQSQRFQEYYKIVEKLIDIERAYICTMDTEEWRDLKNASKACPERDMDPQYHREGWERMLDGGFGPGEASLVIKTDLNHKNPAVRDFVGMRINEAPHPLTGDRYRVYPLYNLSVAIDDHLMGCTHILRGNDHLNNTYRQEYVYRHLGWDLPRFHHYGLVSIPDTVLKTSLIKEEIQKGNYTGWDDIRTGTLRALSSRGIQPDALRKYWEDVGLKSVDISFSWDNLYAMNKEIVEKDAKRFFFIPHPVKINVLNMGETEAELPLFPDEPDRGTRYFHLKPVDGAVTVYVPEEDLDGLKNDGLLRLKDLCNIKMQNRDDHTFSYEGEEIGDVRREGGSIVQWLPEGSIPSKIIMPDGALIPGISETSVLAEAEKECIVQFERVGFFKLKLVDGVVMGKLTHK